ncbi:diguanylate cyclase [Tissierella sp. Yu-01]|uniref:diguanylate cyclase domain-containing protein n=1 Tax=Tissierella sp. Yu-01 TaxID=3035694 RepID=UPI00240D2050|nr:diguanylate cyclase [Tissierella sp. Yu-01]WFA08616.1 diguanylate cyclase [Tissierella sp. Yu-01]
MEKVGEGDKKIVGALMNLREQIKDLNNKISDLEIMDEVTQLYNRKELYNFLDYEVKRSQRYSNSLSVLLLRINNYTSIREKLGEQKTNVILAQISKLLKLNTRDIDIIGRYSDDTFMIILPDTNSIKADIIAERMQRLIESEIFLEDIKVTLNSGIKQYEGEFPQNIIDIALQNLCVLKR